MGERPGGLRYLNENWNENYSVGLGWKGGGDRRGGLTEKRGRPRTAKVT